MIRRRNYLRSRNWWEAEERERRRGEREKETQSQYCCYNGRRNLSPSTSKSEEIEHHPQRSIERWINPKKKHHFPKQPNNKMKSDKILKKRSRIPFAVRNKERREKLLNTNRHCSCRSDQGDETDAERKWRWGCWYGERSQRGDEMGGERGDFSSNEGKSWKLEGV